MRGSTSGPATRGGRRALWWCVAASSVIAFGQGAWIWTHRMVGAFDPDEAGYLATSLRFARTFSVVHPYDFVYSVGATGTGPLVPLLSAPLVMIGPRDPRMAMMIQPVLAVVSALAVSAIARRFTSDAVAVVAGVAYATLPAVLLATQSYWFGLGTATALLVATWALLASDRGRGRGIWWFGVALGAMLLVRTMALGFAPGLVLGAALLVEPTRRGFLRLGGAIAIAAAIAGPWWIVGWDAIFGYLVSYGYGPRAGLFGSGGPLDRLAFRFDRIISSIGIDLYAWAAVAATIGVSLAIVRRVRRVRRAGGGGRLRSWWGSDAFREATVIVVIASGGLAALVSTSNNGVWFELPIVALVVVLGAIGVSHAPRPVRWALVVPVVGTAAVHLAVAWWLVGPDTKGVDVVASNTLTGTHYEAGFAQYDERFATARRPAGTRAAAQWRRANSAIERELRAIYDDRDGAVEFTMSGNMQLMNSNSVTLAAELRGWSPPIFIPDTALGRAERARSLSRWATDAAGNRKTVGDGRPVERVLLVGLHDHILFTPDAAVAEFAQEARRSGWRPVARIALPGGGAVEVLVRG